MWRQAVEVKANELQLVDEARQLAARRKAEAAGTTPAALADEYLDARDLDDLPRPDPLIDGVLARHTYALLTGRDGTFKSFVALDWAFSLATGRRWQGIDTERVRVLYVAGEGAYGIADRRAAWETAWSTRIERGWFTLRRSSVNLYAGGPALDELLTRADSQGYGLVVIDTLRKAAGGADGNGSDMGVVVDNIDRIKRATVHGSVLVIAHTDKGDNDTRGYSGIEDDADIVWHTKIDDDGPNTIDLVNTKMKDGPTGAKFALRTVAVPLPLGRSSLVLGVRQAGQDDEATGADRQVLDALRGPFIQTGATIAEIMAVTGVPQASMYRVRGRLLAAGLITSKARGSGSALFAVSDMTETPDYHPRDNPTPDYHPRDNRVRTGDNEDNRRSEGIDSHGYHGLSSDYQGLSSLTAPYGRQSDNRENHLGLPIETAETA